MIYTSYFRGPTIGDRISISRSIPKGYAVADKWTVFQPSKELLQAWKKSAQDEAAWAEYVAGYRALLRLRRDELIALAANPPQEDVTLLCWEKDCDRCHRSLVGKWIAHFLPALWGGEVCRLPAEPQEMPQAQPEAPAIALIESLIDPIASEESALYQWILSTQNEISIADGIFLHPHIRICNGEGFLRKLVEDTHTAIAGNSARSRYGALAKDLAALKAILENSCRKGKVYEWPTD
jgi:uncharacterized protein YeaO (DUF488 family)